MNAVIESALQTSESRESALLIGNRAVDWHLEGEFRSNKRENGAQKSDFKWRAPGKICSLSAVVFFGRKIIVNKKIWLRTCRAAPESWLPVNSLTFFYYYSRFDFVLRLPSLVSEMRPLKFIRSFKLIAEIARNGRHMRGRIARSARTDEKRTRKEGRKKKNEQNERKGRGKIGKHTNASETESDDEKWLRCPWQEQLATLAEK